MKAKDFRFSFEALRLFLKGLNLFNEDTLILAYRLEERSGNLYMIITYNGDDCLSHDIVIFLGYDKNLINF